MLILVDNEDRLNAGKVGFPDFDNQFFGLTGDHEEVDRALRGIGCADKNGNRLAPYAITWVTVGDGEPWAAENIGNHDSLYELEDSYKAWAALPRLGRETVTAYCESVGQHDAKAVLHAVDLYQNGAIYLHKDTYPVDVLRQKVDNGIYGDVSDSLKLWLDFDSWAKSPEMSKRLRPTSFGTVEFFSLT